MKLQILGSSSSGNCYIFKAQNESLIVEAGVRLADIKKALEWKLSNVVGAIVTHQHDDHAKSISDLANSGIAVFALRETLAAKGLFGKPFTRAIEPMHGYKIGGFKVLPLAVKHDVPCVAYVIEHAEMSKAIFVTDTVAFPYQVDGINVALIEANYSDEILTANIESGAVPVSMRPRLLNSHMELSETIRTLQAQNLSNVDEIVLIHLSSNNSDARLFQHKIVEATGKIVVVADSEMTLNISKPPF